MNCQLSHVVQHRGQDVDPLCSLNFFCVLPRCSTRAEAALKARLAPSWGAFRAKQELATRRDDLSGFFGLPFASFVKPKRSPMFVSELQLAG